MRASINAMILAAGLGTRLRPITLKIPKPAVPFLNVPTIHYSQFLLSEIQPQKTVINTHHLADEMKRVVLQKSDPFCDYVFSHEPQILGSGGGVWNAQKELRGNGTFVAINGDNVILPRHPDFLKRALEFHHEHQGLATLLAIRHPRAGIDFNALWTAPDKTLKDVSKVSPGPNFTNYHFIGIQIFSDRVFQFMPEGDTNIFKDTLLPALAQGEKVMVFESDCEWYETGDPKSFLDSSGQALRFLSRELRNSYQRKFLDQIFRKYVSGYDLSGSHVHQNEKSLVLKSPESRIGDRVHFHSFAVVGSHSEIGSDSVVRGSVILDHAKVNSNSECFEQLVY